MIWHIMVRTNIVQINCPDFNRLLFVFSRFTDHYYERKRSVMAKSYFAILGISSGATADEIRSAYRRLAKEFHPDRYEGDSERFRDIQEAYSVLGNSRRRREYERKISKVSLR